MNTNEIIYNLLDEKVNEIFHQMQNELNIKNGDITPFEFFELDEIMKSLTNKIDMILKNQK